MEKRYAIIVAGGEGSRAGGDVPKQFRMICGKPMLWWSMKAFHDEDPATHLILVLHPGFFDLWDMLLRNLTPEDRLDYTLVCGGRSRWESVKNGLMEVPDDIEGLVAVHDAARPLLSRRLVASTWAAAEARGAVVPAVPVTDSLRRISDGDLSQAVDRKMFVAVQTPQTFSVEVLKKAYSLPESPLFTDDASVVEASGFPVSLTEGDYENMKVTNPRDFEIAELLLSHRQ